MSLPVEFLSGADADLQQIFNRFEDYRHGFGAEFMTVVDDYLTRIAVFPEIAPVYYERDRRQVMQRFPYGVFYEPYPRKLLSPPFLIYGKTSKRYCNACDTKRRTCSDPSVVWWHPAFCRQNVGST